LLTGDRAIAAIESQFVTDVAAIIDRLAAKKIHKQFFWRCATKFSCFDQCPESPTGPRLSTVRVVVLQLRPRNTTEYGIINLTSSEEEEEEIRVRSVPATKGAEMTVAPAERH
jgi:hypothetical protein